jgi:heme/copper-type cytochrome/quinol oxidase subunit 2
MLTISHVTLFVFICFCILVFFVGFSNKSAEPSYLLHPLGISFFMGILVVIVVFFAVYPFCSNLNLCAPTQDTNIYHPLIPLVGFPIFCVPYWLGLASRHIRP